MFWKFLDDLNFVARCKKYNIGLWQCPNFLFLVMGMITVAAMTGTYFASQRFASEGVTIMSVTIVVSMIMTVGSFVIRGVEKVAEANVMKTEFISIISHQLCTPLSAIKWNLEIIETEQDPDICLHEKQLPFLQNIKGANEQMLKMVTDLLELARIDQGRSFFDKKSLELGKVVLNVLNGFQNKIREKKIAVDSRIAPDISDVLVDEKKMKMVLENLIGNAIKYSHEGGKVQVSLKEEQGKLIFSVRDWGVGIPQFQQKRVFEKFFRSLNSSHYQTEGVGIGLYLVRAIVEELGGEVWFESEAEKGSTFYFKLPIAKP